LRHRPVKVMDRSGLLLSEDDKNLLKIGRALFPRDKGSLIRFKVVKALLLGPKTQAKIVDHLGGADRVSRQAVSKACKELKQVGIIEEIELNGKRKEYRLTVPGKRLLGFLYQIQRELRPYMESGNGEG